MTIGEKILNLRKARGWSQEELAERIGVSRQAVSRWESDSAKPDADKIIAICDLFGVSADYLLRDIAAGLEQEQQPFAAAEGTVHKPWFSWLTAAFGGITLFVLRILASVNRTHISPVFEASANGGPEVMVSSGYYTGFSYYVENNGLEWLVWLASIALITGASGIIWAKYKAWKKLHPGETD